MHFASLSAGTRRMRRHALSGGCASLCRENIPEAAMRLFIAIPFSEEVRSVLLDAQEQLRAQGMRANYSQPGNLHLTLAFLGETDRWEAARQAMSEIAAAPFSLTIAGSGRFGNLYWAGVRPCRPLEALARSLQSALCAHGFAPEQRPFRPHITLARQASGPSLPRLQIPETTMEVNGICLMQSERRNGRLTYLPLFEKRLALSSGPVSD